MPQRYLQVVMTAPHSGAEAEFNEWYHEFHIPDVQGILGNVTRTTRYRQADVEGTLTDPRYVAIYELDTDDAVLAYKTLMEGLQQTGTWTPSDSLNRSTAVLTWGTSV